MTLPAGCLSVTDVLGRQRETEHVWPDGSYRCPFCGSAVSREIACTSYCRIDHLHCGNPFCIANPHMPPERAAEIMAKEEEARRDLERRERDARAWRERMDAAQHADDETWSAARAEAERRGACIECLRASCWRDFGSQYNPPERPHGRARLVRHRGECPRERERRWRDKFQASAADEAEEV